ncbi:hypothetical protein [Burkholderia cepacia]|nr:hypothetical protein [Burkholderia cepacia]
MWLDQAERVDIDRALNGAGESSLHGRRVLAIVPDVDRADG